MNGDGMIGIDLAKNVFQVHGVDADGDVVIRRQFRRSQVLGFFERLPACRVGMEACATSHHWARQLVELGHEVKLMPPHYVKPYVKRNKNDMADAEAICETVTRPTMRFVAIRTPDQQSVPMLHRTRHLFIRQRTTLINALRAHLAELGIVPGSGAMGWSGCWRPSTITEMSACLLNHAATAAPTRLEREIDGIMHPAGRPGDQDTPFIPVQPSDCVLVNGT